VLGDVALQDQTLEDLASAVNYRHWLVSLALPYLGEHAIEIGAGQGDYVQDWADAGLRITASEAEPRRLELLRRRFARNERVDVVEYTAPSDVEGSYSAVIAYNVLEHVPDDVATLRGFAKLLRPGGVVVLIVPAFEFAMGRFDRAVGHQRRYRVAGLRTALAEAGLLVERNHYVNSLGLLAWFVGMRLLRMTPRAGPILTIWDRGVIPILRSTERRWRPPFGQSVFAVGRLAAKPATAPWPPVVLELRADVVDDVPFVGRGHGHDVSRRRLSLGE
jgi:SAM-dependent methyltransferase